MTKSYNYIPTHFLYFSLLFFLLIFMYQLIHCHTPPFHFPKFFFFRIYVPTTYTHRPYLTLISTRPAFRFPHISAPNQPPQINPQRHRPTDTRAQPATQTNPPTTTTTHHRYPHNHEFRAHTAPHTTTQPPQTPTDTHRHATPQTHNYTHANATPARPPPTLTTHREAMPCPDVVAAPMHSQSDRPGTGSGHTKPDSIRPRPQLDRPYQARQAQAVRSNQARRQAGYAQDQAGLGKVRSDQVSDRPGTAPRQTGSGHIRQAVTRQAVHRTGRNRIRT